MTRKSQTSQEQIGLYTPEQRVRRDSSIWTTVQAILAPLQFAVFLVSLGLVLRYLITDAGYEIATVSIIAKAFRSGILLGRRDKFRRNRASHPLSLWPFDWQHLA